MNRLLCGLLGMLSLVVVHTGSADDDLTPEQIQFFESKIRPVLVRECYSCHSTQVGAVKGGLWLDTRTGLETGGDSGPAVVGGNLEDSLLWLAINHDGLVMPPRKKLSDEILADFRKWIEMGAPDPRVEAASRVQSTLTDEDIERGREFWSFRAPQNPQVPAVESSWPLTDIDRFIAQQWAGAGLEPNDDVSPATLLRRVSFTLVGLPPTPEQIQAFEDRWAVDPEAALREQVDTLLASPQYGERWGRHWLDVARYAESTGREQNVTYPHAWRYRDYVIDAFNDDKPYHQFLQEQLAGDLLPARDDQQWAQQLVATGFLALGPKALTEQNGRQFELDLIDEQIDVTTRVMLGVSVACARCHDHKFDPIRQTDYYAVSGIFRNMTTHYGTVNSFQNRQPSNLLILPVEDLSPFDQPATAEQLASLRQQLAEKRQEQREAFTQRRTTRSGESQSQTAQNQIINAIRLATEVGALEDQLNRYDEQGQPYSFCMGVQETNQFVNARLLERGEFDKPAQEVPRGFPEVLCPEPVSIAADSSGRLEFARWVGSEQNPLTARVMVNRIWLQLMGQGLVRTPENFGATGQPPTHPELLDYLAVRFVEQNWSVKQLIREIVCSRVFRVSSQFDETKFRLDPENQWWWRGEPRRLDAEALRDALLAISGQLDTERPRASRVAEAGTAAIRNGSLFDLTGGVNGGPGNMMSMQDASPEQRRQLFRSLQQRVKPLDVPTTYRSVYLPIVRDNLPRSLEVFDFAEPTMVVGQRESSNTPDQGLYFLNNAFVLEQCDALARRLIKEQDSVSSRLHQAFVLAYGRPPTPAELAATEQFYTSFNPAGESRFRRQRSPESQQVNRLSAVCQAILAAAEFRYLD